MSCDDGYYNYGQGGYGTSPYGSGASPYLDNEDQLELYQLLQNTLPEWLFQDCSQEIFYSLVKQFALVKSNVIDQDVARTYILDAAGIWLDQHAKDRGTYRYANETDAALQDRLRHFTDTNNVNSIIGNNSLHMFDGYSGWLNRSYSYLVVYNDQDGYNSIVGDLTYTSTTANSNKTPKVISFRSDGAGLYYVYRTAQTGDGYGGTGLINIVGAVNNTGYPTQTINVLCIAGGNFDQADPPVATFYVTSGALFSQVSHTGLGNALATVTPSGQSIDHQVDIEVTSTGLGNAVSLSASFDGGAFGAISGSSGVFNNIGGSHINITLNPSVNYYTNDTYLFKSYGNQVIPDASDAGMYPYFVRDGYDGYTGELLSPPSMTTLSWIGTPFSTNMTWKWNTDGTVVLGGSAVSNLISAHTSSRAYDGYGSNGEIGYINDEGLFSIDNGQHTVTPVPDTSNYPVSYTGIVQTLLTANSIPFKLNYPALVELRKDKAFLQPKGSKHRAFLDRGYRYGDDKNVIIIILPPNTASIAAPILTGINNIKAAAVIAFVEVAPY